MEFSPELLAVIVGFLMPPLLSLLKNPRWPSQLKLVMVGAVSIGVGMLGVIIDGSLDLNNLEWENLEMILTAGAIAFAGATTTYKLWFQNVQLNATLEDTDLPIIGG